MKYKKRPLTLLEVLISLTLVVVCALPLISSHVSIYKEQKKYIQQVENDHKIQQWFANFYQKLLTSEISWQDLKNEEPQEINEIPGATYQFQKIAEKKGKTHSAYLFEMCIKIKEQKYLYKLPIKHENQKTNLHTP